jgi:hypothetical protein
VSGELWDKIWDRTVFASGLSQFRCRPVEPSNAVYRRYHYRVNCVQRGAPGSLIVFVHIPKTGGTSIRNAAAERCGVEGEEVASHGGLGMQELRPGDLRAVWGGVNAVAFEDLPHRGRGDPVPQADEFTVDAPIARGGILGRQAEDESAYFGGGGWPSRRSGGLCPAAGADSSSVPSQGGFGFDDQKRSVPTGTCHRGVQEREDCSIGIGELWPSDLTLENQDLVA